jgi:AcrR family transcriptional regulator
VGTPDQRTQRQRVEESARRLAQAAIELIAERGYSQTTAKDIGLRAGYSRAMVAERFGSKEALLDAILEQSYERRLTVAAPANSSGLDQVLSPIDALREFAIEDPQTLRAMFVLNFEAVHNADALRQRIKSWLERLRNMLTVAVATGQQDGSIRRDLDPAHAAADIIATGIGHAYSWIVTPEGGEFESTLARWRANVIQSLQPIRRQRVRRPGVDTTAAATDGL